MVYQKLVHNFRGGAIFRKINKLENIGTNPTINNIFDIILISGGTSVPLLFI